MYILFDTNIWRSELALNSSAGAATRFFVRERGATVVVPEVVRLELERILFRTISEFVEKINKDHRQLLTIFGELKELVLPDKSEIKKRVERFVDELDIPVKEMPFTIQEAKSSFLKVVDGMPPSGDKNQQFKDGVIWAHCVELLKDRDVYLVTEDRSFFKDKDKKKGLAENLKHEIIDAKNEFYLLTSISELLDNIRIQFELDENKLVNAYLESTKFNPESYAFEKGFNLQHPPRVKVEKFATELAHKVFIKFELEFDCSDILDREIDDAILTINGDGSYDTESKEYRGFRRQHEALVFTDETGERRQTRNVLAVGTAHSGHRLIRHTVLEPLQ